MFSGITNQMSTWMGKKAENGTEATDPASAAAAAPAAPAQTAEADFNADKKDSSPTKIGSKLEMLAGVKSQMTGWISGGIQGLTRAGVPGTGEGENQPGGETGEPQLSENVQEPTNEHVKDDDASSATGGADSGPASLDGTPTEDKNGQQAFGAVSTKALAGAKSLGGLLYSAVNKAGKTVVEASAKIKKTVGENRLIAELNKEQEAFIASKHAGEKGEAVAPWVGAPNEDALREECLSLSTDRRNFLRAPPPGVEFDWDFEAAQPVAQAILALDPNLDKMRFELVPSLISEENFWRNYFYRVSLLRQSHELQAMASQEENNPSETIGSTDIADQSQARPSPGRGSTTTTTTTTTTETSATTRRSGTGLTDSPAHEFVSDSMRVTDTDLQEVREGMRKLGMQPPKEEDWERELEAELKDYEVVATSSGQERTTRPGRDEEDEDVVVGEREDWERQIDELLANDDENADLK